MSASGIDRAYTPNHSSPQQWYVHPDHLNRPSRMTDANQTVVWDAYYWPYGQVRAITGTATNNLRFPGQYFLAESGLHYNWHRHYDPTIGRYTQADPMGFLNGPSIYAYARSAPTMYVDPQGLAGIPPNVPPSVPGGPWSPAGPGQQPGTFFGPQQPSGPRAICRWVPPATEGGPPGSEGYWKVQDPGSTGWNRFDPNGQPLTPEEAHPNPPVPRPPFVPGPIFPIPLPAICQSFPGVCGGPPNGT
jgi:RHS repeat-associated protein